MKPLGSIDCTYFMLPNGKRVESKINNIYEEDAAWFKANNAKMSAEQLRDGELVIYADVGIVEDGDPIEAIELSMGRSCEETCHALRLQAEEMLKEST